MPLLPADDNSGGGAATGLPEAPQDGKLYGRKDAAWEEIPQDDERRYNRLDGLQGSTETERYHLTKNQYDGAIFANDPSATNPYLTEADLP